ncbi:hypothetical protein [Methyloversatilis universalis]|nr:hypothetical protein [Methyloversatilis universalis]
MAQRIGDQFGPVVDEYRSQAIGGAKIYADAHCRDAGIKGASIA